MRYLPYEEHNGLHVLLNAE